MTPTTKLSQDSIAALYCTALQIAFDGIQNKLPTQHNLDVAYNIADEAIEDLKALITAYEGDEI
jgi:hypothetical protein